MSAIPGQQVTGNESVDQNKAAEAALLQRLDQLEESLKGSLSSQQLQQQTGVKEVTQPQEYKLNIHGQEFKFNSLEEASRTVEQALEQTRTLTAEQLAAKFGNNAPNQQTQTKQGFDDERFAELIKDSPAKGLNYALGQIIFGAEVPDAGASIRQGLQELQQLKQYTAANQFKQTNEQFRGSPEELAAMERVRQELGLPTDNPKAWEVAHSVATTRGWITPQQQNTQQNQNFQQQNSGPILPPGMGRESATSLPSSVMKRAEQLPAAELEKFINEISAGRNNFNPF